MLRIDAHIHYNGDHPECVELLEQLDLKLLNVCVVHDIAELWRTQVETFRRLAHQHSDRYAWCTSFDLPDFDDPEYAERAIAGLEQDSDAVGCKIWKSVGMSLRKPSGEFVLPDDPVFDPIYAYLARTGRTLLAHIGEPLACWRPLVEGDPHYGYYSAHPEWHMYGRAGFPSHQQLIDARDRVLASHPKLRVVGAHLGSLEYDVAEVAKRLDRYPNFAVDTSARVKDLAIQDSAVVRQFFLGYQDRLIFGTDIVQRASQAAASAVERREDLRLMREQYESEFAYFEANGPVQVRGYQAQGLGLPDTVLLKLYQANAVEWYAGL